MRAALLLLACLLAAGEAAPTVHISSDRAWYRPGETVCLRALLLDAVGRAPVRSSLPATFRVLDAQGRSMWIGIAEIIDGVAGASWTAPAEGFSGSVLAMVGDAAVSEPRRLLVARSGEGLGARVAADLLFDRDGYAPGDDAGVVLRLRGADGAPAANRAATVRVALGGGAVREERVVSDAEGRAALRIPIPATLERREGTVTASVDGEDAVAVSRSLPLASPTLQLALAVESGALVAGLPAAVVLQARSEDGRPVACRGVLADGAGTAIAAFAGVHEGRCRIAFTPVAGTAHVLRIEQPVRQELRLPAVLPAGAVLLGDAVQAAGAPLRLHVRSTLAAPLRLRLARRGVLLHERTLAAGDAAVAIDLPADRAGVMDAALLDAADAVVAQRTLFRRPARRIALAIEAPARIAANADADLVLRLRDAAGAPVRGLCSLAVVEAGDEDLLPARERPPRLPELAWLDGEVEDLSDPGAYLGDDATSAGRLDLLLSAQAWRLAEGADARRRRLSGAALIRTPWLPPAPAGLPRAPIDPLFDAEIGGQGAFIAIGAGGGGAGLFGSRTGGGRKRAVARGGGTRGSESAMDAGLRFLKRHQSIDGGWSAASWPGMSTERPQADGAGSWTGVSADRSGTALCILAFLGAGYEHKTPNKYRLNVAKGLAALRQAQTRDGRFDADPSAHALATMAMAEAYAMTNDPDLRQPAQAAVGAALAAQHPAGGWAASGEHGDPRLDATTSAWHVMALKSAYGAGLDVGEGMRLAQGYLVTAWQAANPGWRGFDPYKSRSTFPATYDAGEHAAYAPPRDAAGACMAIFLGHRQGDPVIETLGLRLADVPPLVAPLDPLHTYWSTLALFQLGGDRWTAWNAAMRELLVAAQRRDGDWDGSWDPALYGNAGTVWGRLLGTALTSMDLQIYYRYSMALRHDQLPPGRGAGMRSLVAPDLAGDGRPPGTSAWWVAEPCDADGRVVLRLPPSPGARRLLLRADALDAQGGFAVAEAPLAVTAPVALRTRLPARLLAGDRVAAPVTVEGSAELRLEVDGAACAARLDGARVQVAASAPGRTRLLLAAAGAAGRDDLDLAIDVAAGGAPWRDGGQVRGDGRLPALLPAAFLPGTLHGSLSVEDGVEAVLQAVHAAFLREPHGCFEQTSSTSYPLLASCERRRARGEPDAAAATAFLARAAALLQGYAAPSGGYSLYGRDPGDPILTAYGLRQLRRLGGIVAVDEAGLLRARDWLLRQRRGDGGFADTGLRADPRLCDVQIAADLGTWCPPADRSRAYAAARGLGSAYAIGLAARLARESGEAAEADALAGLLALDGTGCARRPGASPWRPEAAIEATALAVLACTGAGRWPEALRGLDWLGGQRRGPAWDTTQANVLAIEACAAGEGGQRREAACVLRVLRDGREVARLDAPVRSERPLRIDLPMDGDGGLQVACEGPPIAWRWQAEGRLVRPQDAPDAALALRVDAPDRVALGAPCAITARATAREEVYAPMLRLGLPAALEPRAEALDLLVRAGRIGRWEWAEGELRLYGERIAAGTAWEVAVPCVAVVAGATGAMPSCAYPYYQPARAAWVAGLQVRVE